MAFGKLQRRQNPQYMKATKILMIFIFVIALIFYATYKGESTAALRVAT